MGRMPREDNSLQVAHYYPWVYLKSGIERVILEICRRSRFKHTVFTNHFDRDNTYPEFRELNIVELSNISVKREIWPVLKAAVIIGLQAIALDDFDALIVHCEGLGDLVLSRRRRLARICFCHTPLRVVFDMPYRQRVLARYRGLKLLPFHVFSSSFKVVDRLLWHRYEHVFFNSTETLVRAKEGGLLRGMEGKYEVLHPGIDWYASAPTWRYRPYFLVSGRIMWTKNIEDAIRGFMLFKDDSPGQRDFRLIIAGCLDEKSKPYLAKLRTLALDRDDIDFTISPSDQELRELYADCHSLIFPSFNEDWGIVPLEANAYGKPVIATNRGGPRESQLHGETGLLIEGGPEAFAGAMAQLAGNEELVRRMGQAARENARRFDWGEFAGRVDTVIEGLCGI